MFNKGAAGIINCGAIGIIIYGDYIIFGFVG